MIQGWRENYEGRLKTPKSLIQMLELENDINKSISRSKQHLNRLLSMRDKCVTQIESRKRDIRSGRFL